DFSGKSKGLPEFLCSSAALMFGQFREFSRTGVPRVVQPRKPSLQSRRGVFSPAVGATDEQGYTPPLSGAPRHDGRSGEATRWWIPIAEREDGVLLIDFLRAQAVAGHVKRGPSARRVGTQQACPLSGCRYSALTRNLRPLILPSRSAASARAACRRPMAT